MENVSQQANVFEFPPPGADLSQVMYSQCSLVSPPPPFTPSPYQFCELIYTPVNTPTGMAMAPSIMPFSTRETSIYGNPLPSLMPPIQACCLQAAAKSDENGAKIYGGLKSNADFVNGIPAAQWKSMTDKDREDFLKLKRRQEAFKTALCQGFAKYGECKYGNTCRFAHGNEELRLPKYNHPKYKTVLCRTYAITGECPYGSRCQFIHEMFQGAVPTDYILSINNTHTSKSIRKTKTNKNVHFLEEDTEILSVLYDRKSRTEVRESKKTLHVNNETNKQTDFTDTFDKMFDSKKFFSRSCNPQFGA